MRCDCAAAPPPQGAPQAPGAAAVAAACRAGGVPAGVLAAPAASPGTCGAVEAVPGPSGWLRSPAQSIARWAGACRFGGSRHRRNLQPGAAWSACSGGARARLRQPRRGNARTSAQPVVPACPGAVPGRAAAAAPGRVALACPLAWMWAGLARSWCPTPSPPALGSAIAAALAEVRPEAAAAAVLGSSRCCGLDGSAWAATRAPRARRAGAAAAGAGLGLLGACARPGAQFRCRGRPACI